LKAARIKISDLAEGLPFTPERWLELVKTAYQNGGNFLTMA